MKPWQVPPAIMAAALAVVVVIAILTDSDDEARPLPGPAAALARMPADAPLTGLIATSGPGRRGVRELLERVPGSAIGVARVRRERLGGLDAFARDLDVVGGGPVAFALTPDLRGFVAAWEARDPAALRAAVGRAVRSGALRRRGPILVPVRGSAAPLRALAVDGALLLGATDPGGLPRRSGRGGARPALPAGAVLHAVGDVRRLRALPEARRLAELAPRTVAGARGLTLTVTAGREALTARARVALAPGTPVPLAAGARPAAAPAAFATPLTVGLRDPRASFATVLRALGATEGYARASRILRRLRRDDLDAVLRDQLTGTATVAVARGGRVGAQLRLRDDGDLRDLLGDLARIPDLLLGRSGIDVDEDDGLYTLRLPGAPVLRVAVEGDRVGVVAGGGADPRAVARRGPAARTTPGAGALAARVRAPDLRQRVLERLRLPRIALIALEALGDLSLGATAAPGRLDATATLAITP